MGESAALMLDAVVAFFVADPLLLLFVVCAIGYPLGRIQVAGSSLGVAAVLFVGLAFGALDPGLKVPEVVHLLGLVFFVYTVGLSSGAGFFRSFRRGGIAANALVVGGLTFAAVLTVVLARVLGLRGPLAAGLFAGSLTNTPALAAVLQSIETSGVRGTMAALLDQPVVGYSITYPVGVIGMILAIQVMQRLWRTDYAAEAALASDVPDPRRPLHSATVRVTRRDVVGLTLGDLTTENGWVVVFGRTRRGSELSLVHPQRPLEAGDLVTVVGSASELADVIATLGEESEEHLEFDHSRMLTSNVFVSNPRVAGQKLSELNLPQRFGAILTRVRRGDVEFVPRGETVIEPGDQVRVLSLRDKQKAVTNLLGNSYRALSEIDIMTFSLGIGLGLILGAIPIPVPFTGGLSIQVGFAGGPLIVALILGALGRTGSNVWTLPYSANLTLRQVGLTLFLAGIGTRAGGAFFTTLRSSGGLTLLAAGAAVTCLTAFVTLIVGHKVMKIPMGRLIGMLSGLQTQPAVLSHALEQTGNEMPNVGYAMVYPVAIIAKIVLAQLVLSWVGF
jgi:putative transport protein